MKLIRFLFRKDLTEVVHVVELVGHIWQRDVTRILCPRGVWQSGIRLESERHPVGCVFVASARSSLQHLGTQVAFRTAASAKAAVRVCRDWSAVN